MDLTASILAATNTKVPADARHDGVNIFPVLQEKAPAFERTLFWRSAMGRTQRAVRSGDWKLIVDGTNTMLFDVRKDPGERNDMTYQHLDVVAVAATDRQLGEQCRRRGESQWHRSDQHSQSGYGAASCSRRRCRPRGARERRSRACKPGQPCFRQLAYFPNCFRDHQFRHSTAQ